jgi:hypothetical protein
MHFFFLQERRQLHEASLRLQAHDGKLLLGSDYRWLQKAQLPLFPRSQRSISSRSVWGSTTGNIVNIWKPDQSSIQIIWKCPKAEWSSFQAKTLNPDFCSYFKSLKYVLRSEIWSERLKTQDCWQPFEIWTYFVSKIDHLNTGLVWCLD